MGRPPLALGLLDDLDLSLPPLDLGLPRAGPGGIRGCKEHGSLQLKHCDVKIAIATVGDAGSGTLNVAMRVGRYSQEGLFNGLEGLVGVPNARVGLTRSVPWRAIFRAADRASPKARSVVPPFWL